MRKLAFISILLLATSAWADEGEQGVHVDLDAVIEAGKVAPVDGITSAGQPNEAALQVFADSGYAAVIDMRGPEEDRGVDDFAGVVEQKGMEYIAFPISDSDQISFETAAKLDALLEDIDGPVLVHCASGNRVGALLALRHSLNGASDEEALAHGKNAGMTRLEPRVREVLESE
jgi:uncharacterized protein (TIGR01244 family)